MKKRTLVKWLLYLTLCSVSWVFFIKVLQITTPNEPPSPTTQKFTNYREFQKSLVNIEKLNHEFSDLFPPFKVYAVDLEISQYSPRRIQKIRKKVLKNFCMRHGSKLKNSIEIEKSEYSFYQSNSVKFGCGENYFTSSGSNERENELKLKKYGDKQSSFGFMFVKDPVHFAIESFFDEVIVKNDQNVPKLTLDDILTYIINKKDKKRFPAQIDICNVCTSELSFIGRFENFDSDFNFLAHDFGEEIKMKYTEDYLSQESKDEAYGSFQKALNYFDTIDAKEMSSNLLKKLIWLYRFDYLAFGYNPYRALNKTRPSEYQ